MVPRTALILLTCVLAFAAAAAAERLPTAAIPEHYDLAFTPDLATETFEGRARIRVKLTAPTHAIILNAADLTISEARVETAAGTTRADVSTDAARERMTVALPSPTAPGVVTLDLQYSGRLTDRLRGFYISKTKRRKYAATQFEVADARRAFPCFDEPAFKATFDVALTIDAGDVAISNGKVVSDTPGPGGGKHTMKFARTPKMSTYLVAMAVGDFKCLEGRADGTPIRVCAVPEKVELGAFALAAAEHILPFFNRYYGIPYPFEKLDVVGLPDFAAGAMENTGAVFYRESFLLADERSATPSTLKLLAWVMSHEIAHQWFGDLVTMQWWDDLWLNEGFATWAAHKAVEGWRGWSFQVDNARDAQKAMSKDGLLSIRPIRTRLQEIHDIEESFDDITYAKAAAVLRMVEQYIGADAFRAGVSAYLRKFSYGNATTEDFWNTLAETSGKPVDRIMSSFVEQPGVPVVAMRRTCHGDRTHLTLTQRRFLLDPAQSAAAAGSRWAIPVCFDRPGQQQRTCELLSEPEQTIVLPACAAWVVGNDDALGYYRVEYDAAAIDAFVESRFAGLSDIEQQALEADVWATVRAGGTDVGSYLRLAEALVRSPERSSVEAIVQHLWFVSERLVDESHRPQWQAWVLELLRPIERELGWTAAPGESVETKQLRAAVLAGLGALGGDERVLAKAVALVDTDLAGRDAGDPTVLDAAYLIAPLAGGSALYERILKSMPSARTPPDFYRRQKALAYFREATLIDRTLAYALSNEVRNQDAALLMGTLLVNPAAEARAWTGIKGRWAEVKRKSDIAQGSLQIVSSLQFCDRSMQQDVERFFQTHEAPGARRAITRAVETIGACAATKEAQQARLAQAIAGD